MPTNSIIEQEPLYTQLPVGQEVIFVVSNNDAVANQLKVKFIADIHISSVTTPNLNTTTDLIGSFKTTPNNAGVGIFDIRNIIENYVSADNMAADGSAYKGTATASDERHPIHLINQYSLNKNIVTFLAIRFSVEYLGATDTAGNQDDNVVRTQDGTDIDSDGFNLFNGYVKYTDKLDIFDDDFGFSMNSFIANDSSKKYLTNAPAIQYANLEDYGTLAFWQPNAIAANKVYNIKFSFFNSSGDSLGTETVLKSQFTGAMNNWSLLGSNLILYFGCFPANLQNWSTVFNTPAVIDFIQGGYYTIQALDSSDAQMLKPHTINVNCPNGRDYESIRLCWLNQWGAWDYYTFTKKSAKSISTKGSTYQQLAGSWNESVYRLDSYKGGKKAFRVNATEKITMNTGFVVEDENVMFEELINSPEVYLLDGYQTDTAFNALNQYVTPVRLTTSSFTRKTIANDRLIQYTFEIEKSKTLRTQSI
jgi:hypothetical protein